MPTATPLKQELSKQAGALKASRSSQSKQELSKHAGALKACMDPYGLLDTFVVN